MAGFLLFQSRGLQQTSGVRACKVGGGNCVGFEPVEGSVSLYVSGFRSVFNLYA